MISCFEKMIQKSSAFISQKMLRKPLLSCLLVCFALFTGCGKFSPENVFIQSNDMNCLIIDSDGHELGLSSIYDILPEKGDFSYYIQTIDPGAMPLFITKEGILGLDVQRNIRELDPELKKPLMSMPQVL